MIADANAAVVVAHPMSSPTAQLTPATAAPATTTLTRVIPRRRFVDAAQLEVQHEQREQGGHEVGERECESESRDAQPRVQRERERRC